MVTGGAGYIGAHVVKAMAADGMDVIVLDDLSTGDATRVTDATLITGTIRDRGLVRAVMREHAVDGVMHIAAKKQVGQSVSDPLLYYRENVDGLVSYSRPASTKESATSYSPAAPRCTACLR